MTAVASATINGCALVPTIAMKCNAITARGDSRSLNSGRDVTAPAIPTMVAMMLAIRPRAPSTDAAAAAGGSSMTTRARAPSRAALARASTLIRIVPSREARHYRADEHARSTRDRERFVLGIE